MQRRHVLHALAAAPLLHSLPTLAQSFPDKPIKLIVPLPPGSPPDVLARIVAEGIQRAWKQPVVVENRPGGTGSVGMKALASAPPDGYTLGVLFLTHTVLPELMGPLPYDTVKDLAPVANLVSLHNVLVVPTASRIQSLPDLIEAAKAQPERLTFGSGGMGSPAHLVAESFCQATGVKMMHVPFKGPSEAVNALMGDHVHSMFATSSVAASLVKGGKVRALAVTSPQRLEALPQVATLAELGWPGLELREWEGLVAPAGTPRAIIQQWNTELFKIMGTAEVKAKLAELGMSTVPPNSPEEFSALVRKDLEHWARFVRSRGLRAS